MAAVSSVRCFYRTAVIQTATGATVVSIYSNLITKIEYESLHSFCSGINKEHYIFLIEGPNILKY